MKMNSARVKIVTVGYVVILAVIIFVANTKSTRYLLNFMGNIPYGDKIGHFFLMGVFALLLNWSLNFRRIGWVSIGSLFVLLIVTIEEVSQLFIRGRTFAWGDLLMDVLGIIILGEIGGLIVRRFLFRENV